MCRSEGGIALARALLLHFLSLPLSAFAENAKVRYSHVWMVASSEQQCRGLDGIHWQLKQRLTLLEFGPTLSSPS